jgi:thermitase
MNIRVSAGLALIALATVASAQQHVPDELIVKYHADESVRGRVLAQMMGARATERNELGITKFKLPANVDSRAAAAQFRALPDVVYAEPNFIVRTAFTPNDPRYASQYAPKKIFADIGWAAVQGSANIRIAIIDTGVDGGHPDLAGKLVPGYNFVHNTANAHDDHGHGTHCAGIAAAATNNGIGIAGVGFNSSIMPIKVLSSTGSGTSSNVANGIIWAANNGAHVISLSLGSTSFSEAIRDAVDYAWNKGSLVVGAAGNNGNSTPFYPAAYDNAISVGSTDANDQRSSFSNFGTWVDVAAPGSSIDSTLRGGGYGLMSGTSMAAPHVAGQAALLWAQLGVGTSVSMVRQKIESTTDPVGSWLRTGRINVGKSLEVPQDQRHDFQPSSVKRTRGTRISGGLADLLRSDDARYVLESTPLSNGLQRIEWWAQAQVSIPGQLLALEITSEVAVTSPGAVDLTLYNWGTKKWISIGSVQASTADVTHTATILNTPSVFVGPAGEVRVRYIGTRPVGNVFRIGTDLVRVTTVSR